MSSEANWAKGWLLWAPLWGMLLAVYWVALFTMTHLPGNPVLTHVVTVKDKSAHTMAFGLLAVLFAWVVFLVRRRFGAKEALAAGAVLAFYAAFDELTQPLVGRSCDIYDWLADVVGIVAGTALVGSMALVWRWQRVRSSAQPMAQ